MTEAGELRARLRSVDHDLEHVVRERDEAAAEAARLRAAVERVADDLDRETAARARVAGATPCCDASTHIRRALDGDR
jgi:chorismate mutase